MGKILSAFVQTNTPFATVIKKTDEVITTDTTIQDDNELKVTLRGNKTYSIKFTIFAIESTSGAIKGALSIPTGATGSKTLQHNLSVSDLGTIEAFVLETDKFLGVSWDIVLFTDSGTPDQDLIFQWAQNSSNGNTTLKAGSYMVVYES